MKKKKDSESLAIDILTFLTGISSRDGDKFPVLRRAIRAVGQQEERGLLLVIHELRSDPNPLAGPIADHIESLDRKSTRLNSSHVAISYAVFCLKKKIQL